MIDDLWAARPQSGLSSADVVWHAPAEGGIPRYMALFQTDVPEGGRARPQLAAVLRRLGGRVGRRCTSTPAARPRRSRTSTPRRAAATSCTTRTGTRTCTGCRFRSSRRTTCTPTARACSAIPKSVHAKAVKGQEPVWTFAARRPARAAARGRHDRRPVPLQPGHLQVRPQDQHLPPLGVGRGQAVRRGHQPAGPDRAQERDRDEGPVRPDRRQEGPARRRHHRAAGPPGSRPTARRSRASGASRSFTSPDPVLRQERQRGPADRRPDVHPGRDPVDTKITVDDGEVPAPSTSRPRRGA